jgi:hypothetical protein
MPEAMHAKGFAWLDPASHHMHCKQCVFMCTDQLDKDVALLHTLLYSSRCIVLKSLRRVWLMLADDMHGSYDQASAPPAAEDPPPE